MTMMTREQMPDGGWKKVPVGTEITEDLFDGMLNVLPPISLRSATSPYCGFQVSEPIDSREDETGKWRSRFMTFVNIGKRYFYAGLNFAGRCDWRLQE